MQLDVLTLQARSLVITPAIVSAARNATCSHATDRLLVARPYVTYLSPLQADWSPAAYAALVRFALKRVGGPKVMLASVAPHALPAPGAAGLLGGTTAEEAR